MNPYPLSEESEVTYLKLFGDNMTRICAAYLDDENKDGLASNRATQGIDFSISELEYNSKTFNITYIYRSFTSGSLRVDVKISGRTTGNSHFFLYGPSTDGIKS